MTEEIIVNGFDVSECYADNKMMKDGLYCFWEGGNCEDNEYCYYKECRRLEQEKNKYYQQTLDDEILMNELSLEVDLRKKESDFYLEKLSKYRSALEEIRTYLNTLSSIDNDFPNTETYLRIQDKINEVLN